MNTKNKLLILGTGWSFLGFTRGMNYYDYNYKKDNYGTYLYTSRYTYGIMGLYFYLMPPFSLFVLNKEIYRLEVNIRGLEEEKNSDTYNNLLF